MNPLADALRAARELLAAPESWTRVWSWRKPPYATPPYTLDEAVFSATRGTELFTAAMDLLREVISGAPRGNRRGFVAEFNDADERTHAEVLAVLDEAIRRADAEGAR